MRTKTASPPFTRAELISLSNDIRLACMRISRRVRFESDREMAPHQFSVLCRLEGTPRTNSELAEIERVSAPSMKRTTTSRRRGAYPTVSAPSTMSARTTRTREYTMLSRPSSKPSWGSAPTSTCAPPSSTSWTAPPS